MKYLLTILLSSILFAACSSSKVAMMDPVQVDPCTNSSGLTDGDVFTGETVDNVVLNQQGALVYLTMDVHTYCNAALSVEMQQKENQIVLMISNTNTATDNTVGIMKTRTALRDLAPGTYDLKITDKTGYKLLHKDVVTIPE